MFRSHLLKFTLLALLILLQACSGNEKKEISEELAEEELYQIAKSSLSNGNYQKAIRFFRRLQGRFPLGKFTEQAELEIAYAYYKDNRQEDAVASCDRFVKLHPTHENVDYAYYLKGLTNFKRESSSLNRFFGQDEQSRDQEYKKQSFLDFSELVQRFPNSRYSADARERMVFLRDSLAIHEIYVANYYLSRGAHIAAANRAKGIVENYQQTSATGDAMAIMVQAYSALELTELADDALRVLTLNYPDHPYLTGELEEQSFLQKMWPF